MPMASVRCAALRGLAAVLALTETLPPSDAKVFQECVPSYRCCKILCLGEFLIMCCWQVHSAVAVAGAQ